MKMYALLSDQGTACGETALCGKCYETVGNRDLARKGATDPLHAGDPAISEAFTDCGDPHNGGNDALLCCICNWPSEDDDDDE